MGNPHRPLTHKQKNAACYDADKTSMVNTPEPRRPDATLRFTYGTMGAGKSTLALQLVWQLRQTHNKVDLWTFGDRSREGLVTSRIGISAEAKSVTPGDPLTELIHSTAENGFHFVVVDEAQFATPEQIDEIASLVDNHHVAVHCFALATDFKTELFPGSARLFAVADSIQELPLVTYCWCGKRGKFNARIVDGSIVYMGNQMILGDVNNSEEENDAATAREEVTYKVLCREHYHAGEITALNVISR